MDDFIQKIRVSSNYLDLICTKVWSDRSIRFYLWS